MRVRIGANSFRNTTCAQRGTSYGKSLEANLAFGEPQDCIPDVSWERVGTNNYYFCLLDQTRSSPPAVWKSFLSIFLE